MRRITKAALGGLAGCALVLGGTQAASGALEGTYKFLRDDLVDPAPLFNDGAFADAKAKTTIRNTDASTTFTVRLTGIDTSSLPEPFPVGGIAAHLHIGPCDNSGGHYQHVIGPAIDAVNEAWLAFVPDADGMAIAETTVEWVPNDAKPEYAAYTPGEMSIVVHKGNLQTPGPKQACFPLSVPDWADPI